MSHVKSHVEAIPDDVEKTGDWRLFINLLRQANPSKLLLSIAIFNTLFPSRKVLSASKGNDKLREGSN